jgi:hypothetical protein
LEGASQWTLNFPTVVVAAVDQLVVNGSLSCGDAGVGPGNCDEDGSVSANLSDVPRRFVPRFGNCGSAPDDCGEGALNWERQKLVVKPATTKINARVFII